jgi:glycosyltransferase involved in cell wall biosynthesis
MKIVIATGIYPPEVGGPALYAKGVKESLERSGYVAPVVLFARFRSFPTGVRHCLYAYVLWRSTCGATAIFAFDTLSVGIPSVLIGMLRGIPVVIRIGGDFVWETYLERTKDLIPLPVFYLNQQKLSLKERIIQKIIVWMLHHARLAFNTQWLIDIWKNPYNIDISHAHVVENAIDSRQEKANQVDRSLLFYSRQIALKNHQSFKSAFEHVRTAGIDLQLEEGMIPHDTLIEKMRSCYAVAVPSISEVAPNNIIDAICCGKPFLLTKYSSYAEKYKEMGIIIDPLDEGDMARGIKEISDPLVYERLCANIANYTEVRTYDDVTRELLVILE